MSFASGPDLLKRATYALLLLLIFSLALMQPSIPLIGFLAVPTDFLFLAVAALWLALVLLKQVRLEWDPAYAFIAVYLLAMFISVPGSESVHGSLLKLLTQLYLAGLTIVVSSLVDSERQLRAAALAWLTGSTLVGAVAVVALLLFAADPNSPLLQFALSVKGTLPPGNYPRLQMTFMNPNMACNYLTVSLMLAFAARRAEWIDERSFAVLFVLILIAAMATISPGLGGIALGIGIWAFLTFRSRNAARLFLSGGIAAAFLFVGAMAVTPILHPTAPYLIHVPLLGGTLAPSGRLMIWTDAVRNFLAHPLTGRGIGVDPVSVEYLDPSGLLETSTDAHEVFLSLAVQCGVLGLAALLLLMRQMVVRTLPLHLSAESTGIIRVGIGIGLLIGFVYEGLGGSFEDARHLWVAFGLLLASSRLSARSGRVSRGST